MAQKTSSLQGTSRSFRCHHVRRSSILRKTFGSSCGRTGFQTACSKPSTISSTTAALRGTPSSINRGRSCPSPNAIGRSSVNHCEDWYKGRQEFREFRGDQRKKITAERPSENKSSASVTYRFTIGQTVYLRSESGRRGIDVQLGPHVVTKRLPPARDGPQYEIRSAEGDERTAPEWDLVGVWGLR